MVSWPEAEHNEAGTVLHHERKHVKADVAGKQRSHVHRSQQGREKQVRRIQRLPNRSLYDKPHSIEARLPLANLI